MALVNVARLNCLGILDVVFSLKYFLTSKTWECYQKGTKVPVHFLPYAILKA